MATTARGVPYPVGTDDNASTTWFLNLANFVNDAPGIATLTTTQRDALAGGALWVGRQIYNTTVKEFQYYTGITGQLWVPLGHQRGEIVWLAYKPGTIIPGYLEATGGVVSQTTYADLFALLGTKFNIGGEGAGNWRLPNMKRRAPVGFDVADINYEVGDTNGTESQPYLVPAHDHTLASHTHTIGHDHGGVTGLNSNDHTHSMQSHTHSGTTNNDGNHNHTGEGPAANGIVTRQSSYFSAGPQGFNVQGAAAGVEVQMWSGGAGTTGSQHQHAFATGGPSAGSTGGISANHSHSIPAHAGNSGGPSVTNTGSTGSATTMDIRNPVMALYPMIKY